jgi:hypothetical protein
MSFPFGGHPTLEEYLNWARSVGCTMTDGLWTDAYLVPHKTITVDAPTGGWVSLIDPNLKEILLAGQIGNYDRRLKLTSPYDTL